MEVSIDPGQCVGHGLCYSTSPEVYADDEQGYGLVLNGGHVLPGQEAAARSGARSCPERAITVITSVRP